MEIINYAQLDSCVYIESIQSSKQPLGNFFLKNLQNLASSDDEEYFRLLMLTSILTLYKIEYINQVLIFNIIYQLEGCKPHTSRYSSNFIKILE